MSISGWVGVDLDATLAHYTGWNNGEIGEPIELMANRVREWLSKGIEVRIVTARVAVMGENPTLEQMYQSDVQRNQIQDWTEKHFGIRLPVTCSKDFAMIELWDDRAIRVEPNTGKIL